MLEQIFSTLGYWFAVVLLLWCVAAPFLALWLAFSIRKSLLRIANSLECASQVAKVYDHALDNALCIVSQQDARRIVPSAFGR